MKHRNTYLSQKRKETSRFQYCIGNNITKSKEKENSIKTEAVIGFSSI